MYTTNILGHILGAINRQKVVLLISAGNAVFNIILNIFLIPKFADKGAAIATVLTETLGLTLSSLIVAKEFGAVFDMRRISKLIASAAGMVTLLIVLPNLHLSILIIIAVVSYCFFLLVTKAVTLQELKKIPFLLTNTKIDQHPSV